MVQRAQSNTSGFYKYALLVLVACVCPPAILTAGDSTAPPSAAFSIAPVNPDFVARQTKAGMLLAVSQDDQGHTLGLIPSPLDRSHLISQVSLLAAQLEGIPSSYDLRTYGYVTPVKDQGGCGSCWAFGSYGPLESWLLKNAAGTWDLSENHLKNYHGFDPAPCDGGNADMSTAYLARWSGPVSETDDPYHDYDDRPSPGGVRRKDVEKVLWFFTSTDIKNALMTYGGMYVSMYWNSTYYKSSQYTYYYSGSSSTNHAVTLIGWDDSKAVTGAPGNGAWLIKNSWGAAWGDSGYFWISYYDSVAVKYAAAFCNAVSTDSYATNYQYDPLGWTTSLGYGSPTAWAANVFTAAANEQLKAVGLYAVSDPTSYVIYVYDNFDGSKFSGLLGSVSGSLSNSGYYTIPLNSPINLTEGNDFSIVVKFTTAGYNWPIPIEMDIAGYSSGATASPGQSYISSTGVTFTDITTSYENTNVCIKGLTAICTPPAQASTPSPANGETGVSGTADLSWTAGSGATSHDVYFGTSSPGTFRGNQAGTTFDTGTMNPNTTYYWRIDEKNACGTTTGTLWSFTTIAIHTLMVSCTTGGTVLQPGIGDFNYSDGNVVSIVASADANYHFVNWTGSAVTAGKVAQPNSPNTTVTMDANYTVEANFAIDQRTLTVSSTAGGTVTQPGIGAFNYPDGNVVDLNAVPDAGYHFANWTGDTNTIADVNDAVTTITMDANYAIQANFALTTIAPHITSTPVTTAIIGQPYTYDVNATGTPEPNYSLITSPAGMTINPVSGLIDWTPDPDVDQIGDANVTVEANNVAGSDSQTFTITVSDGVIWISGYVIEADGNTPVEGILIQTDNNNINSVTDTNGYYELLVDDGWSGTVTPQKEGYVFDPNKHTYANVMQDYNDVNYTATLTTFKIAGYVLEPNLATPMNSVNVSAENGGGQWTSRYGGWTSLTDVNGHYEVWVDYGWSGKVMPAKRAYIFEPNSRYYEDVNEDYTAGQDYNGTLLYFRIAGYIKNECNAPVGSVLVDADNNGCDTITDANGYYEVWVDYNWSGMVTPAKRHYTFAPPGWMSYVDVLADLHDQNYIAGNTCDFDCDGYIDWRDFTVMADNWLATGSGITGDFDADGDVDFFDFAEFGLAW
jgi:C1A family cysteine protease